MSPTKRPSTVAGLRRAVEPIPATPPEAPAPRSLAPGQQPPKPARVTLNMPPELYLYRELERWTLTAADAVGVHRVSIQDALRAMIRAGIHDSAAEAAVLGQLRQNEPDL
jgi:hypothetical protein